MSEVHSSAGAVRPRSIVGRSLDFWCLGGASVALWAVMVTGQLVRDRLHVVQEHFLQVGTLTAILSIFCNYPHFVISYRFGYGRGPRFMLKHWFSLLLVPVGLIALYAVAYFDFYAHIGDWRSVVLANRVFSALHLSFRLGTLPNLGTELQSLSVWIMYLTVGWHYSKQVFGCLMVYANYDGYPLSPGQRRLIKAALFSVAFFNFFYLSVYANQGSNDPLIQAYFFNVPLVALGLPDALIPITGVLVAVLTGLAIWRVGIRNWRTHGKRPSVNFLVTAIAYYIWWIPIVRQPEFYFMVVPFFHSLQYLPFAFRMEIPQVKRNRWFETNVSLRVALLIFAGFAAFELVPALLDSGLSTAWFQDGPFFMIAFLVFINVHHFFIDSVVWKFDQPEVRRNLLAPSINR